MWGIFEVSIIVRAGIIASLFPFAREHPRVTSTSDYSDWASSEELHEISGNADRCGELSEFRTRSEPDDNSVSQEVGP